MSHYATTVSPADVAVPNDLLAKVVKWPQDRRDYASAGADARSSTRGHRGRGIGGKAEPVALTFRVEADRMAIWCAIGLKTTLAAQ